MVLGIGCDLVEISRMKKALEKERFLARYFTEKEREELLSRGMRAETAAGRFAAKEAFSKAAGTGFSGFMPQDVEVLSDSQGAPYLALYGGALERQKALGIRRMHVSITHERAYAQAFVVLEGGDEI